uniref:Uncharacterized protein ycf23 n=1 Tax=Kapraunia schneideri TaxID=717899 RepID=A0A1Z1MS25_9FLOR|nr:hypothetical protein [Kapraunia schneideri]ARW68868.1 hypothetical protein [Kapraunia schneideri]
MNIHNKQIKDAFDAKSLIKVIAGIDNTNIKNVIKIAKAADLSQATYIDIAANVKLVKILKKISQLPICISSINSIDIYNCILAGADIIEIGNYDFFYNKGIYLTAEQIISLVLEVKSFKANIDICVTIPYYISLFEQMQLAKKLYIIGVNILQTEGISKLHKLQSPGSCFDLINVKNTFLPSLLSTYMISKSVNIPVITASGSKNIISHIPSNYGASGIGVGSSLKNQMSIRDIVKYINQSYCYMMSSDLLMNDCHGVNYNLRAILRTSLIFKK